MSGFPGAVNGKPVNGFSSTTTATFPQAAALRNMTPGAAINALLMNKNKHLQGNTGNPAPMVNGLVSSWIFSVFTGLWHFCEIIVLCYGWLIDFGLHCTICLIRIWLNTWLID
jgi:hypothetical protein